MADMLTALNQAGLITRQQIQNVLWAKNRLQTINKQLHKLYRQSNRNENLILNLENEKIELSV